MTTKPLKKGATYDDLCAVPDHFVAEIFDGDLYASLCARRRCACVARRPLARSLEVMSLAAGRWTPLDRYEGDAKVRGVPFDAVELELGALWI